MTTPRWLEPPEDLPERARKYWEHYARGVWRAGNLSAENAERFKTLCRLLALSSAAAAEIEAGGVVIGSGAGAKKSNPAAAILFQSLREAEKLLADFGLGER